MHARARVMLFSVALFAVAVGTACGDDQPAQPDAGKAATPEAGNPAADKPATPADPAVAKFQQVLVEWKKMLAAGRQKQFEYKGAKPADKPKIEEEFNAIVAKGTALQPQLNKAAEEAYLATGGKDSESTAFLSSVAEQSFHKDNYEEALRLANLLIDNGYKKKTLYNLAGVSAFNIADYDTAEKNLKLAEEAKTLDPDIGARDLKILDEEREKWKQEQALRAAEEKANDLPRVVLKTDKGDITVELFENEAPNTVANFIKLVQKNYYNGTAFHRVLPGFMAQGGDPKGTGSGGPGYAIPCESSAENHRNHFRGSLSMAHAGKDTGGSQFFLTFAPTPHLDGQHTVFGRVIDGLDVLSKLTRRNPERPQAGNPDKIIEAKVLRKRNHVYDPQTLPEKGKS